MGRVVSILLFEAILSLVAAHAVADTGPGQSESPVGFEAIYALLTEQCGGCHVRGQADGPWSLNTPPSSARFPECLAAPAAEQLRCATYHQLVDAPAPGIPAWIRPADGRASEPYAQACDPSVSFHIGHSLPRAPAPGDCDLFLRWIEAGAPWEAHP